MVIWHQIYTQLTKEKTHCCHKGYSFWSAARVLFSDVRLTVKSVRFRFQKINRNRNRDLEKNPYFRFLVLFFIHALKCLCKSWLTTQITPVLCGNTLKKERIKAKTVKCKLCTKNFAADYGNASILRRYIENKHKSEFEGLKKNPIKLKNVIKRQFKLCTKQRTS